MTFKLPKKKKGPSAYERGVQDGRDGLPIQYWHPRYRAGWYKGYREARYGLRTERTILMNDMGFGELKSKRHARALQRTFKKRDAPAKACPHCGVVHPNGTRRCYECGFEFFEKVHKPSPFKGMKNEDRPKAQADRRYRCD